jgi:hypothetical protein
MTQAHETPDARTGSTGRRRGLTIGIAGGLLAGTAAGMLFGIPGLSSAASSTATPAVVVQQTDDSVPADDTVPGDDTTQDAPADTPDPADRTARLREELQALVDEGTITGAQADAVAAHLAENLPGRGGPGGHGNGGRGGGGMFGRGPGSEALTELLGIDAETLHTQLHDGSTLAEIAQAQGVEVQQVIDTLVAEATERINGAVADGRIDQAEADEKLAELTDRITDMVNNGRPDRGQAPDAADDQQAD